MWLSKFILPGVNFECISSDHFLIAAKLAKGQCIALGLWFRLGLYARWDEIVRYSQMSIGR